MNLCPVFAQDATPELKIRPEVEAIFHQGVILYNNGNFHGAKRQFERILGQDRWHQRLTATLIMYSKTLTQLNMPDLAEESIRQILRYFPNSAYVEDARFQMGLIHYLRKSYVASAKQMLWAADYAKSKKLQQRGYQNARILLNDYLTIDELKKLRTESTGSKSVELIVAAEAMQYFKRGERDIAVELVQTLIRHNPDAANTHDVQNILSGHVKKATGQPKIGVILPLTGQFGEQGKGVLRGLKFAQLKFQEQFPASRAMEIIVRDSESSIIKAIRQTQELESDPDVLCVVGEVENFITAGIAGVADAKGLPVLAPVATDNGIADIGYNIFQANPTLGTQARSIARYAVDSLGYKTFVTVAPQDDYGHQLVDAFGEEIDRLGAEIMTQRWYYGIPEKLGGQFKEIREIAFRKMLEDSLRITLPGFSALNKDSLWKAYNNFVMLENKIKEDVVEASQFFRVENVDAAFFPVYDEDLEYVARQFKYFNINAQILGSENWYSAQSSEDKKLSSYVNNAIFASTYYFDPDKFVYRHFKNEFRKHIGTTPGKMEIFGYDAGLMLLTVLSKDAKSREDLRKELAALHNLQGKKGMIDINRDRVNATVNILKYENNKVVPLPFLDSE